MEITKGSLIRMINCSLAEFVVKNVERTASMKEQKTLLNLLEQITMLNPREIGHLLFVFASAERTARKSINAITHFKHLLKSLNEIKFEFACSQCF